MWETTDPDGRRVVLTRRRWHHILEGHGELDVTPGELLDAVRAPDRSLRRSTGEDWFYVESVGPSRWLRVVVHYGHGLGWIVTAFARRSYP